MVTLLKRTKLVTATIGMSSMAWVAVFPCALVPMTACPALLCQPLHRGTHVPVPPLSCVSVPGHLVCCSVGVVQWSAVTGELPAWYPPWPRRDQHSHGLLTAASFSRNWGQCLPPHPKRQVKPHRAHMHLNLRPRVLNCSLGVLSIGFSLFPLHTALSARMS